MMKKVVVDASVAAKWVVAEEHSAGSALLLGCEEIHAPEHWLAEAVNVLWSKVLKGDLERGDAEERMIALMRAPVIGTPIAGLMSRAFAISVEHAVTIYDSLYVALAVERGIPVVTADARLVGRLHATELSNSVVWIGDLG